MNRRTAVELKQFDSSSAEEDLKELVTQDILARHRARRLPLQDSAEELRALYCASTPNDGADLGLCLAD
jgi:hypothetical protein